MHCNFNIIIYMQDKKTAVLYNRAPTSQPLVPSLKKYATLSPYLSQIQKRKKIKSVLRPTRKKHFNESSSKSFRIKQKSTTSLHGKSKEEYNKTITNLVNKITTNPKKQNKERKTNSVERSYNTSYQTTIQNEKKHQDNKDGLFQQLYVRVQNKHRRDNSFRKNMYEQKGKVERKKSRNRSRDQIELNKYGYTESNKEDKDDIQNKKRTEQMMGRKNNFRKNKYQALYSSVTSNGMKDEKIHEPVKSQNKFDFNKKQSNTSINKEMDQLAKKQMQRFYRQLRSKQIQKSVQKSTEKYFKQSSNYRPLKSNNDIEIYVSTVKNPSIHKVSGSSTQNTVEKHLSQVKPMKRQNELLSYEFDFQDGEGYIQEIENASQEQSMNVFEESEFEKQRKQVEKEYFDKHEPNIEWSEQDCQIDIVE